jgi:ABC-type multidrug transport system ATPase subunit
MKITGLEKTQGSFSLRIDEMALPGPGIYGLIGPNGCGKTTTAKLIAALLAPDRGAVDPEGLTDRDITMLTQTPYMMDDTVYNNLIYPLKVRKIKPDNTLCDQYLDRIGLLRQRKQRARSLSGGERQKLAMLRALIFKPRFIILDEALTDLDIDSLDMFENMILEKQKSDPVIWLVISHQLPHVKRLCDYIFFMSKGRLETQGPAEEILLRPANPLVRQYLKHETLDVWDGKET